MSDCDLGTELMALRRELAWQGIVLPEFHAHQDKQRVRDRVFDVIARGNFQFDAVILDKTKTQDHLRANPLLFYKEAWFLLFKYVSQGLVGSLDELFVVASALQIQRKKKRYPYSHLGRGSPGFANGRFSHRLRSRNQRSMPSGGRLHDLGNPAKVREG